MVGVTCRIGDLEKSKHVWLAWELFGWFRMFLDAFGRFLDSFLGKHGRDLVGLEWECSQMDYFSARFQTSKFIKLLKHILVASFP